MDAPSLATEGATVRVESSGKVVAYLGTTSHGQSVETTMAQIVADTLGVDYDDVTVVQADSQSTPYGPGTGGSRTAVVAGGAAREATLAVREKVLAVAAHSLEAAPEDLDIEAGAVFVKGTPTRSVTMKDVADAAYRFAHQLPPELSAGLEATVRFRPTRFPTWSNATHLCVVEIDRDTCMPRIVRYIVSEDCGRMINPTVVEGQIFGGVVQGMGGVLLEDFVYDDDGNPLTTTFMDYLLPTTTEVPEIEIGHIETRLVDEPGRVQGHGRGRGDRRPRRRGQRRRRRARAARHPRPRHTPRAQRHPPPDGGGRSAVTDDDKLAVAEAYRYATVANDAATLRAIHEPDALTWHNTDGLSVSVDDSVRSLAWLHRRVPDLRLEDVRLVPTSDGFVVRWTMTGTAPGGPLKLHSCVVVELSPAGKVARAAEYLDSAQLAVLRGEL